MFVPPDCRLISARKHRTARRPLVAAALALLLALPAARAADDGLADELDALLAGVSDKARVALVVRTSDRAAPLFAQLPDEPLKPASVLKLFVTAAALDHFGPDFAYRTRVYLAGNELIVVGAGDPALGDERIADLHDRSRTFPFDEWAAALGRSGITQLDKIVLDDSRFDHTHRHPDWPVDQSSRWYQAPVGALNFNDNCLDAFVRVAGGNIELVLTPPLPRTFIRNELRAGDKHRPIVRRSHASDIFEFVGPVKRSGQLGPASARRPTVFFGHALKAALRDDGITVTGPVVRRPAGDLAVQNARRIAEHRTPLADVLWRCNTFSQNLFAECLVKSLAAYDADGQPSGDAGTWPAGTAVLHAILTRLGVDLDGAVLRDGSGLSHENRVTARQVADLLVIMQSHRHRDLFLHSLAEPGREGSMRRRYDDRRLRNRLHGKTGTIRGVRTLAGYVERTDGRTLAFAVLTNGPAPRGLPKQVALILATASIE